MATIVTRAGKGSALTHAEVDANFNNLGKAVPDAYIQTATPATGNSITLASTNVVLILKHTATIATLTIVLPAAPSNGQILRICTRSTVTTLTLSANTGQTCYGAPSTITPTSQTAFIYEAATLSWYRI